MGEVGPGEDAQSQVQMPVAYGRWERPGQKGKPWPHVGGFAAVSKKTWFVGRVLVPDSFREKGQNATRLVSWADQDVERDQEGGQTACGFHVGLLGQTQGAWLLPTLPPIPHHSRRHLCLLGCQ